MGITFVAIYRQLRLQASQAAIENLEKRTRAYGSERMVRCKLEVLTALRDGVDPAHLPGAFAEPMMIHWEDIRDSVRSGHLESRAVWRSNSNQVRFAWGLLSPTIRRWRATGDGDDIFEAFEWLATTMNELDRRAGVTDVYEQMAPAELDNLIAKFRSQIPMQEALRSVVIASPTPAPAELAATGMAAQPAAIAAVPANP